jgi:hypothetical protein
MLSIDIEVGGDEFPKLSEGQISKLTRSVASRVRAAVIAATPVGNRPLKGRKRTKKSWTAIRKGDGGYSFENPTVQSWFLEHGSEMGERPWPTPRSRTIYSEGRVYSSQAPEGILAKSKAEEVANQVATELFQLLIQGKSIAKR